MNPIVISLIGMAVVICGILVVRMHAFIALILAAFCVTILTSSEKVLQYSLHTSAIKVIAINGETLNLEKSPTEGRSSLLRTNDKGLLQVVASGDLSPAPTEGVIKGVPAIFNPSEPGTEPSVSDYIIHDTDLAAAISESKKNWGARIAEGLGSTLTKIALLIAMASIIGKTLMDSGGAEKIVASIARAVGEKRMPMAFIGSGFTLGIPVFFDTIFYLLMPLGKAMRVKTGRNYLLYVLTIVAGGTMAHSLVPPTPGPLFVAAEMGIDIGLMMIGGIIVGLFTVSSGYLWAIYANKRWEVPLRASEELTEEELNAIANRDESELPSLGFSLLPILLPVVLMGGSTAISMIVSRSADPASWLVSFNGLMSILGDKNIAMTIAALCGIALLISSRHTRKPIKSLVHSALSSGGIIILITAAGGTFGHVLRQTGIAFTIQDMMPSAQTSLIPLGFFICMLIRTAQGSATVAMITAIGIIGPIIAGQTLNYHPIYIALAIGCGSKPISWMNDSGFWVISKMSGLTEKEMLKANTTMGIIMGTVGLVVCIIGSKVLPLI
ncbi:MAG TPA: gluconate transporter [Opitutae bacterium]|nr:gluconate transporter [Opitutaceae bacterium]HCR29834.1 gluconate transporter [Opitutae bacterium]